MQKKTKRLLICLPIVVVLIIAIIVGACFYFNSNQYRFRKSAFYGEYTSPYFLNIPDTVNCLDCSLFEETENGAYIETEKVSRVFFDGDKYTVEDRKGNLFNLDGYLDKNIVDELKKYYNIFSGKCIVKNNELEFLPSGETLKIIDNKFLYEWHWSSNEEYPIRRFKTTGGSLNLNGSGEFKTDYAKKDNMFNVIMTDTDMYLRFSDINIIGEDKKYKLSIWYYYVHIQKFYEHRNDISKQSIIKS